MYNKKYIIVLCLLSLFLIKKFYKKHDDYYTHIIGNDFCDIDKLYNSNNMSRSLKCNKTYIFKIVSCIILFILYQSKNHYFSDNLTDTVTYSNEDLNIIKNKLCCNCNKINEIEKIFDDKLLECKMDINKKYNNNYRRILKNRNCINTLKNCLIKYIEFNEKK